jgi:hypothetical protein
MIMQTQVLFFLKRITTMAFFWFSGVLITISTSYIQAADQDEVEQFITKAMTTKPITGEPYELQGNRIVFTNWYFIRPGVLLWLDEDGNYVNRAEQDAENPKYGPWDAQVKRPSSPYGIEIVAQRAKRVGPILKREKPWEADEVLLRTIIKEGDKYRAWGKSKPGGNCYFESSDGMSWERPNLGLKEFKGSRENNLLTSSPSGCVFIDPTAPPEERYKSVGGPKISFEQFKSIVENRPDDWITRSVRGSWRNPIKIRGIVGGVSPDGIHWKERPEPFTAEYSDGMETGYYDHQLKKYVLYVRTYFVGNRSPRWSGDPQARTWAGELYGSGRRAIGRMESDNFNNFSVSEPVIVPQPGEVRPSEHFYTSIYTTIPGAPEHHLMFPAIWDTRDDVSSIGLWSSHDGKVWNRVPGPPLLETAPFGEWDGGNLFTFPNLIELPNGDFALPYRGDNLPHKYPRGYRERYSGYAVWPKGRIVAVEAKETAEFSVVGIIPPGRTLRINALTQRAGGIRVEIFRKKAAMIPGYIFEEMHTIDEIIPGRTFENCDIIQGDQLWKTVTWKGEADLGFEEGEGIVISFKMDRAKIFGIDFE